MTAPKRYDYMAAIEYARLAYWPERGHNWKRVLRKLVREAVSDAFARHRLYGDGRVSTEDSALEADRIAKELIP